MGHLKISKCGTLKIVHLNAGFCNSTVFRICLPGECGSTFNLDELGPGERACRRDGNT